MIPAELIKRKRDRQSLSHTELKQFIAGYVSGSIPDYQMASLLMAVYFNGMEIHEIHSLVDVMIASGKRMDFSHLEQFVADKHSTGGVGDTVSLVLGPLMAAAGLAIPMLSGRSLGHTGGTLDKLESIPGLSVNLSLAEFRRIVEDVGICMIGQTGDICPADKKMYALRDVTGTVESIPLICGSILSKKIAEGIQGLVMDVKFGAGAFMRETDRACALGQILHDVGEHFGVKTDILYTSMNQPLGRYAGIWCEVREALDCLNGQGPADTMEVTYALGTAMLRQAHPHLSRPEARERLEALIQSGAARDTFYRMVTAQGGDISAFEHPDQIHRPQYEQTVPAPSAGIIQAMDTYHIGLATVELGSGRKRTDDVVDPTSGIEFLAKIGDRVEAGESVFRFFSADESRCRQAADTLGGTVTIGSSPAEHQLIMQS